MAAKYSLKKKGDSSSHRALASAVLRLALLDLLSVVSTVVVTLLTS
jgi:hypothetical protein